MLFSPGHKKIHLHFDKVVLMLVLHFHYVLLATTVFPCDSTKSYKNNHGKFALHIFYVSLSMSVLSNLIESNIKTCRSFSIVVVVAWQT